MRRSNAWPTYAAWSNMKARCTNPNNRWWACYGGRGIKFCESWVYFDNFFADMGDRPSPKHSLDRIDVNGDYEPSNCRWATQAEQQQNRRDTAFVTIEGTVYKRIDLAKKYGMRAETIAERAARGLSFAEVMYKGRYSRTTPTPEAVEARRKKARARTHCRYGHALEGRNLIYAGPSITKQCRICRNAIARAAAARRKERRLKTSSSEVA